MRAAVLVVVAVVGCGGTGATTDASVRDGGVGDAGLDAAIDAGGDGTPSVWLEDRTLAAGIELFRMPEEGYATIADRISGGVCVIDADGRGAPDLFFALRHASRLYVAERAWEYRDETEARGLGDAGDAIGCLTLDADADGDDDLLVTGVGSITLFARGVDGRYAVDPRIEGAIDPRVVYASAAAGDLTGDRRPDLAIAGYVVVDPEVGGECAIAPCRAEPISFEGAPNLLFVQSEDGRFVDRTAELAPELLVPEHTLVVAAVDLTAHGALDLFVGNDLGLTYLNRTLRRGADGVLRDVAFELGMAADRRGYGIDAMGFASGDVNGDLLPDHVVTSFEADDSALYLCGADMFCEDRSDALGLEPLGITFRWGAALVDLDRDGDLDLLEATGHYYTDAEIVRRGFDRPFAQPPNLAVNEGGRFAPFTPAPSDALAIPRAARGIAIADLDDDGSPDVILAPAYGRPALLRNARAPEGRWLRVTLRGRAPDTRAIGARVRVRGPGIDLVRAIVAGEGYLGSSDRRLSIGVGDAEEVSIEVTWPSGAITTRAGVPTSSDVVIDEP